MSHCAIVCVAVAALWADVPPGGRVVVVELVAEAADQGSAELVVAPFQALVVV